MNKVVRPALLSLEHEGVPHDRQLRLLETCTKELGSLIENPKALLEGSLNGQKTFEHVYQKRSLPQVVVEDGLQDVYALIYPRIATLLCSVAVATESWEVEAWSENFRRLDKVVGQIEDLFSKIDAIAAEPTQLADELLATARRVSLQSIRLKLDPSGLREGNLQLIDLNTLFVHPVFRTKIAITDGNRITHRYEDVSEKSFEAFIRPSSRTVLVGPPGAGKSSWTKWFQGSSYSPQWMGLCMRVELRQLSANALPSCDELIRSNLSQHLSERLLPERLDSWMSKCKIVFVFDGFDEIRLSDRDAIYSWLKELDEFVKPCPIVLTSRPLTSTQLENLPADWKMWMIEPFDRGRVINYIERWYQHSDLVQPDERNVDASALADAWMRDPSIGPLTGNPLLLTTLLIVNHLDGSLPNGRSQLYHRYIEGMLGLWDERRAIEAVADVQLSREDKKMVLKGLALEMFFQQIESMEEEETVEVIAKILQKLKISAAPEKTLAVLRERSGLIVGPGIYSFSHKSIIEYLVAEAVWKGDWRDSSDRRVDPFYLFCHRADDKWTAVAFLWAGLAAITDVEAFISQCVEGRQWDLAYGLLYDQYERFSVSARRQFILDLLHSEEQSLIKGGQSFWGLSYMARDLKEVVLEIPSVKLRSLSNNATSLLSLFRRVTEDKTMVWSDGADGKGKMRDLLWMCCAIDVRRDSIEEWKDCIAASPPEGEVEQAWLMWVIEHTIERAVGTDSLAELKRVIALFQTYCPQHKALLPFALMSAGINQLEHYFYDDDFSDDDEDYYRSNSLQAVDPFTHILIVLPGSNDHQIIEKLLMGTRRWLISLECGEPLEKDLFDCFIEVNQ